MIARAIIVPESEVDVMEYDKEAGLIGLMDGGGSNILNLDEQMPGVIKALATGVIYKYDNDGHVLDQRDGDAKCKLRAEEIGEKRGIGVLPFVEDDLRQFEEEHGVAKGDYFRAKTKGGEAKLKGVHNSDGVIQVRNNWCNRFGEKIDAKLAENGIPRRIPYFAAGFMQLLSPAFVRARTIGNIHPGYLTQYKLRKRYMRSQTRLVTGDAWVPPAIAISSGHDNLYSSMHVMTEEMDGGPMTIRGYAVRMDYNYLLSRVDIRDEEVLKEVAGFIQNVLKYIGDHVIAGANFHDMFEGNWGRHMSGTLAYRSKGEWHLVPNGISIEDHVENNPDTPFQRTQKFIDDKMKEEFYDKVDKLAA